MAKLMKKEINEQKKKKTREIQKTLKKKEQK